MTLSSVHAFLRAGELDSVAQLRTEVDDAVRADAGSKPDAVIREVIKTWTDRQAVANLLMHAGLIPADLRVSSLVRGLGEESDSYLQLAAAVGVGEAGAISSADRTALVEGLLDLISSEAGPGAVRAAAEIGGLLDPTQAPDVVVLLRHPERAVRHNLTVALARIIGDRSLSDLLSDRAALTAEDAVDATQSLISDGIDIDCPASDLRMLAALPYLPDLQDWPQVDD